MFFVLIDLQFLGFARMNIHDFGLFWFCIVGAVGLIVFFGESDYIREFMVCLGYLIASAD